MRVEIGKVFLEIFSEKPLAPLKSSFIVRPVGQPTTEALRALPNVRQFVRLMYA